MATDVRRTQPKVTYGTTMSERMDDVHREFDRMIAAVRTRFGETYPMYIGGAPVESSQQFEDRSPIDRRILLGRFQLGAPEHVREAVAAARERLPALGRDTLGRSRGHPAEAGATHSRASYRAVGTDGVRSRQEPARMPG